MMNNTQTLDERFYMQFKTAKRWAVGIIAVQIAILGAVGYGVYRLGSAVIVYLQAHS